MIHALRAGAYGIPFMPVGGMWGSDLVAIRPEFFQVMKSPFDDTETVCVKALVPDYAIIHVQEADIYGNCRILGPSYQDALMARAAKKTIITTERINISFNFKHFTISFFNFLTLSIILHNSHFEKSSYNSIIHIDQHLIKKSESFIFIFN